MWVEFTKIQIKSDKSWKTQESKLNQLTKYFPVSNLFCRSLFYAGCQNPPTRAAKEVKANIKMLSDSGRIQWEKYSIRASGFYLSGSREIGLTASIDCEITSVENDEYNISLLHWISHSVYIHAYLHILHA